MTKHNFYDKIDKISRIRVVKALFGCPRRNTMLQLIAGGVCAPKGFAANGVHCGIRKNKIKKDLALITSEVRCAAACVYTQNLVKGAPILVTKEHVKDGYARAVIVNSGNANTCNANGVEIAEKMSFSET